MYRYIEREREKDIYLSTYSMIGLGRRQAPADGAEADHPGALV